MEGVIIAILVGLLILAMAINAALHIRQKEDE